MCRSQTLPFTEKLFRTFCRCARDFSLYKVIGLGQCVCVCVCWLKHCGGSRVAVALATRNKYGTAPTRPSEPADCGTASVVLV